jgi:hypothetical protein
MPDGGLWDAAVDAVLMGLGVGIGAFHSAAQGRQSGQAAAQVQAALSNVTAIAGAPLVGWPLSLAPEPGIRWTRTGGKSWRVVIVR